MPLGTKSSLPACSAAAQVDGVGEGELNVKCDESESVFDRSCYIM